jgi:hypothetical protein
LGINKLTNLFTIESLMMITFVNIETVEIAPSRVLFPAKQNNQLISCAISCNALEDDFGGNGMPPLECFRDNRPAIEAIAMSYIERGRFEQDGSIYIRSQTGTPD